MSRLVKYLNSAIIVGWYLVGCTTPPGPTSTISPTFILKHPLTDTPTPIPLVIPPSDITAMQTMLPATGQIVPIQKPGLVINPEIFFAEETILMDSMGITAVHPATGAILKLEEDTAAWFPNPTTSSPLSPDRKRIAYAIGGRSLVLLNLSTADKSFFNFPGTIKRLIWMPDNKHILINVAALLEEGYTLTGYNRLDWLFYFNIETNTYTLLYDDFEPNLEEVSPDGKSFFYYDESQQADFTGTNIVLGSVSGSPPVQMTDDRLYKVWMDLTTDGQQMVIFAFDPAVPITSTTDLPCHSSWNTAYLLDVRTRELRDFPIAPKSAIEYIRLSPDGKKIAYVNAEGKYCADNFPIYILDLESGVEERLEIGGFDLGWSPDGSKLVFLQYSTETLNYRQLVIYDLLSHQILTTYYIEDINGESAIPYWVNLKDEGLP
jgi:hypothetical protein